MLENRQQKLCLGTVSRLVKQGGIRGVGVTMITQRPADLNKKVLSQVDILTVLRMSHPRDLAAATDWIKSEVSPEFAREVGEALPSLPVGTAFVCSASLGIGQRIEVRPRETFNSGATPEPGQRKAEPKVLATVDIERLGREIADAAKRIQETSPEFLLKRIAELERAGKQVGNGDSVRQLAGLQAEVDRLKPAAEQAERLAARLLDAETTNSQILVSLRSLVEKLEGKHFPHVEQSMPTPLSPSVPSVPVSKPKPPIAKTEPVTFATSNGLSTSEQKVLDALASLEAVGVGAPSKTQLAAFAGYSNPKSGGFAGPAAALVRKGLIESNVGRASMTFTGRDSANKPDRPATSKELQNRIFSLLGEGERKLLTLLIAVYPESLSRVDLAVQGGYSNAKSGGFAGPLARLVELGFVEAVRNGVVRGSEMLFLKGRCGGDEANNTKVDALRVWTRADACQWHVRDLLHPSPAR